MWRLVRWYALAPQVWVALIIGWLWFLLCLFLGWKVGSAGGMLVGACIVAELFYLTSPLENTIAGIREHDEYIILSDNGERKYLLKYDDTFNSVIVRESDGSERRIEIQSQTGFESIPLDCRDQLYEISASAERKYFNKQTDTQSNNLGPVVWDHQKTTARIKKLVLMSIVISAVFGTIVWAYF